MIHTAMNEFAVNHPEYTATPMSVANAMSQGYIGYDLQNAIRSELVTRGISKTVSTVLTQVTVDPYDEAFYRPAKVIGRIMTAAEAEGEEKKGNHVTPVDAAGKEVSSAEEAAGYRRVVATPKPIDIVEIEAVEALLDAGQIVIACGGGGIPVLSQENRLKGASAVIEKDTAAGRMAELLSADMLIFLTGVEKVCLSFGKADERPLDYMSVADAEKYLAGGEFGKGTMEPKIRAAIDYIGDSAVRRALITKLIPEQTAINSEQGTLITLH